MVERKEYLGEMNDGSIRAGLWHWVIKKASTGANLAVDFVVRSPLHYGKCKTLFIYSSFGEHHRKQT